MGSAVVKPLSKRRGKIKPSDPDDNRDCSVQGNQNGNVTKKSQEENIDIGEPTKPLNVNSMSDTATELGKPISVNTSNQDTEKHQHTTRDKSAAFYDSDEEPYPIQLAKNDCSNTNDATSAIPEAGKDTNQQLNIDNSKNNEKVRFTPHLPLSERRHPSLTSEHHRFRRFSCFFRSGTSVSCSPFRTFRKSGAKVSSENTAQSQEEQAETNSADKVHHSAEDAESQQVDVIEKDICCDARSPSPEYDKLVDLQIVNPSTKSVDNPAVKQRQSTLNVSFPDDHSGPTKGCLAVDDMRLNDGEIDGASSEINEHDPEIVEVASEEHEPAPEVASETGEPSIEDPAPKTVKDGLEGAGLDLDILEERMSEKCYTGFISSSSSKENTQEQLFDDHDTCPVQLLDVTRDFENNSNPGSQCQSVEMCCTETSPHCVHTQKETEKLYRTFGVDEIKEQFPALSPSNSQESSCKDGDAEMQCRQNKVENTSDMCDDTPLTMPTRYVPNFPDAFQSDCIVNWPDDNREFGRFNFSAGDDLKNSLCHNYTGNICEQLSEYEFRTMSPIKEESIGYEALHEPCMCEPQSNRTSRCSSGKSVGGNERSYPPVHHSVENNNQLRSEHLFSSSRNSLHKNNSLVKLHSRPVSGSRSKQSTPQSCPASRCMSRQSTTQSKSECLIKQQIAQQPPVSGSGCKSRQSTPQSHPVSCCNTRQTTPQPCHVPMCKSTTSTTSSPREEGIVEKCQTELRPNPSPEKASPRSQDNFRQKSSHHSTSALSQNCIPVKKSESSTWASGQEPTATTSKTSFIQIEQNVDFEHIHPRCRPNSEKLYAAINMLSSASKTRPISANVLYPLANQNIHPSGVLKLPPISSSSSMTAGPLSAKQNTSKSEVFLPTPRPDSGRHINSSQCRSHSRPGSGKQVTSQSRPTSGSSRPRSGTFRPSSGGDRSSPQLYSSEVRFDRPDHSVRLSPICFKPERQGCGEQWTGHLVHEVDVNECQSATDLRVTTISVDCEQLGFGDGPHASDLNVKKSAECGSTSSEVYTSQSATEETTSRTNMAACSTEKLTSCPDSDRPCWGDGPLQEETATPTHDTYNPQVLTLSADQIGSIRQQLYEEGLKPAERDGGVAFFIPMTVDGLQPQANGVMISDRLTRSRKSSLSYEERLILANINRQAQLHKRKEFAVKDIQNVKGASSSADTDRSKHEDEIDADLDTSY